MRAVLIRLYPAGWRARYGGEFAAVLDERALGPFDVADIVLGALDARLRLRGTFAGEVKKEFAMSLRIGGIAAIIGSGLLTAGVVLGFGLVEVDQAGVLALVVAGSLALIVAVAGMSAFQARAHPALAWVAFLLPGTGLIVVLAGALGTTLLAGSRLWWEVSPWDLITVGALTAILGSSVFAYVTYQTGVMSRAASVLLGAGAIGAITVLSGIGWALPEVLQPVVFGLGMVGFVGGWFVLGVQAIRIDHGVIVSRPT